MIKRFFGRITEFLGNVKIELKKVSYPTRAETVGSTTVVLILVTIVGIYLAGVDQVLVRVIKEIIQ
ncbi:MAG TPA: preprotein translocase subunit SecE [Nitrospiria bacterium]